MLINCDNVVFNGGSFGGLVKLDALHGRLKKVEDQTNTILNRLKSVRIPLAPSGTYPLSSDFGSMPLLTIPDKSEIENEKIKQ
jgi:hypothetical protein